ncbi:MAG TPA: MFS transporter [Opitutaceae bacterium]|jgi:ACS family hexuronate transporter-like MFS transporter|nr:MFS transporter [Opitutaceae bacterium]
MSFPPATPSASAEDARPWRWVIIALLFLGTVMNYLDRLAIPVLSPVLQAEFKLTNVQYATISSWFLIVYALSMFAWGAAFDRLGNRTGFSLAVVIWSLAEMGHALARGFGSLCGMRALLGLSESGNWPGATRTIAAWFPARQRALAMGIANTGASLGPALAPPLIIWLQFSYGWRTVFLVTGLLGFVWLALWLALYPRTLSSAPRVAAAAPARHPPVPWRVLLRRREVWGIVLARFFGDPIWWLFLNWLPLYLYHARGFSLKEIAAFAWAPFVAAALGALSGGWFSGFLLRRGWGVNRARKTAIFLGTVCLTAGILAAYATSASAALAWLGVTMFGFQFWVSNVQTLPSDFFPVGAVGSIAGFAGTAAGLGAVIFTMSTGWVVDHFSYTPILIAAGLLGPLATAVLFILVGKVRSLNVE